MKEALYILGEVVHQLQLERGSAALFLGSEGKLFGERMLVQTGQTDGSFKALQEGLERWQRNQDISSAQIQKIETVLSRWKALPVFRQSVLERQETTSKAISHYSHALICILLQAMVEIALHQPGNDPARVNAFNAFLQWKERVGLERAIGLRGFIGYSFHNQEFVERMQFLLAEQKNYLQTFLALASPAQRQWVDTVNASGEVRKLDEIHALLETAPDSGELYDLTPEAWFDLVTEKVDALRVCEVKFLDMLAVKHKENAVKPEPVVVKGALEEYSVLIRSLQIFSGLSEDSLSKLLSHSQVRSFQKGKLLFLEGEQANRLYVVLKGWVKLFKGTAAGEETILQMLSGGDVILESAVFLNTAFPVSAQIAEDAILLSLPAPMVREQLRDDNELALNMLASMSLRSQNLIRQIESARLKTVDERIGWYLLKLLLEQGGDTRCIDLPFDKSLIASYLDMKRETFSRALGRLKDKGFQVENHSIVIPNLSALCDFCDTATAVECVRHSTNACPNPQQVPT